MFLDAEVPSGASRSGVRHSARIGNLKSRESHIRPDFAPECREIARPLWIERSYFAGPGRLVDPYRRKRGNYRVRIAR